MSGATIIKLSEAKKNKPSSRSGRYSTVAIYERAQAQTNGDHASQSAERPRLRVLPSLDKDRPGMATDYSCRLAPKNIARIQLSEHTSDHYWIDWVFVPPSYRSTGTGRRLMNQVVADADYFGVNLSLEARACAGLSQEKLEAWYRGFGFFNSGKQGPFGPILMRTPARTQRRAA